MTAIDDSSWLGLATSPSTVRRALVTMAIVGPILISINHGDALVHGTIDAARAFRMVLTLFVPYCVSTVSTVGTLRSLRARAPTD